MNGSVLPLIRVGLTPFPPYVNHCALKNSPGEIVCSKPGIAVELMLLLVTILKHKYRFELVHLAGKDLGNWGALVKGLQQNEVDMGLQWGITLDRMKDISFGDPMEYINFAYMVPISMFRTDKGYVNILPFGKTNTVVVSLLLIIMFGILPAMHFIYQHEFKIYIRYLKGIWNAWHLFLTSGWPDRSIWLDPKVLSIACVSIGCLFYMKLFRSIYDAKMTSTLVKTSKIPFTNIFSFDDFLDQGKGSMITQSHNVYISHFNQYAVKSQSHNKPIIVPNPITVMQRMRKDNLLVHPSVAPAINFFIGGRCENHIEVEDNYLLPMSMGFVFKQNSTLRHRISKPMRIVRHGLHNILKFNRAGKCDKIPNMVENIKISFGHMEYYIYMYFGAVLLATLGFMVERRIGMKLKNQVWAIAIKPKGNTHS